MEKLAREYKGEFPLPFFGCPSDSHSQIVISADDGRYIIYEAKIDEDGYPIK